MGPILAIDLGGSQVKMGIVEHNSVLQTVIYDHDSTAPLEAIFQKGKQLISHVPLAAVGICVPGIVNHNHITSLPGKLTSLVGMDLSLALSDIFGVPSTVSNDAIAFGTGEVLSGAGVGMHRILVMTIGTGIGIAVLENGNPVGTGPLRGSILSGFIPIGNDSLGKDSMGQHGTIEACCSAQGLVALSQGLFTTVPEILTAASHNNADAKSIVASYKELLITALIALVHAHTPERIVIGGGPVSTSHILIDGLEDRVNNALFPGVSIDIKRALLGDFAALVGIAHIASMQ